MNIRNSHLEKKSFRIYNKQLHRNKIIINTFISDRIIQDSSIINEN